MKLVVMGYANYFFQKNESFLVFLVCSCTRQGFSRFISALLPSSPGHPTGRFNPFGLNRFCSHLYPAHKLCAGRRHLSAAAFLEPTLDADNECSDFPPSVVKTLSDHSSYRDTFIVANCEVLSTP